MYGAPRSKDLNLPSQQHPAANGVQTPPQMSSPGLLRYRSAPSAMFGDVCGDFLPASAGAGGAGHRPGSPDTSFARLLSGHHHHQHHPEMRDKPPRPAAGHFAEDAAAASMASEQQQLMYQSQQQMAAMEGLFRTASSGATDPVVAAATGGNDSLLRQSSSPAGFLNHLNMGNGFGNMLRAGMAAGGGAAGGGGYRNGDARLKGQLSFSSRQGSVMSQISEMVGEEMGGGSSGDDEAGSYGGIPGYPVVAPSGVAGWDEPSPSPSPTLLTSDGLSGPAAKRRPREDANGGSRQLKPQFSLPAGSKPPPEMAAIEKFLQFQDSVPCKIRAKRGCATHPRSIAERVRRTKISERIRKLQELVPNMEKQTNTSDMLDLAVDYIKELQMQVKVMNDGRASCTCAAGRPQKHFAG